MLAGEAVLWWENLLRPVWGLMEQIITTSAGDMQQVLQRSDHTNARKGGHLGYSVHMC